MISSNLRSGEMGCDTMRLRLIVSLLWDSRFSLSSPTMKGREIRGTCDLDGHLEVKNVQDVLIGPAEAERAFPSTKEVADRNLLEVLSTIYDLPLDLNSA
jgi:hypothetical protein